jgi:hypothetical protein
MPGAQVPHSRAGAFWRSRLTDDLGAVLLVCTVPGSRRHATCSRASIREGDLDHYARLHPDRSAGVLARYGTYELDDLTGPGTPVLSGPGLVALPARELDRRARRSAHRRRPLRTLRLTSWPTGYGQCGPIDDNEGKHYHSLA